MKLACYPRNLLYQKKAYDRVVVLQVASTAFSLKSSPEVVLRHGIRLSSPTREVLSIQRKLRLQLLNRLRINKEQNLASTALAIVISNAALLITYSTMTSLEAIQLLHSLGELILRNLGLQHLLDKLPELLVFVIEQHDKTCRCCVETVRHVKDVVFGNLLDTSIGDGDLVGDLVNGSAVLAGVEEVQ